MITDYTMGLYSRMWKNVRFNGRVNKKGADLTLPLKLVIF